MSSFQAQYGIRLSKEVHEMPWIEFKQMLAGIGPDTALGRVVAIRSETDNEILKHFTKEQNRIRNEWLLKRAKHMAETDMAKILDGFKQAFIQMAGGDNH